jgi:hypothetical protein
MRKVLIGLMLSLALGGLSYAQSSFGITPQQKWCLVDNYDNFFELRIYQPDNGQMILFGHVHNLALPNHDPCYTQDYTGTGRLWDATSRTPLVASFTLDLKDARPECRSLVATLSGSVDARPIIYAGEVIITTKELYYSPTGDSLLVSTETYLDDYVSELLPDCSTHP